MKNVMRAIGLMLVDARLEKDAEVTVEIRGARVPAVIVGAHLQSKATALCPADY